MPTSTLKHGEPVCLWNGGVVCAVFLAGPMGGQVQCCAWKHRVGVHDEIKGTLLCVCVRPLRHRGLITQVETPNPATIQAESHLELSHLSIVGKSRKGDASNDPTCTFRELLSIWFDLPIRLPPPRGVASRPRAAVGCQRARLTNHVLQAGVTSGFSVALPALEALSFHILMLGFRLS